ncbi:unnamed protein product [Amoebophrya sp. A120]|nr:unnamed protein product [Amoebophrya sp. A120]|eukprot:GSA120T00016222001.1
MPPASGVGITSIPRQCDRVGNLNQCSQFHKQSNCNKPSQKPAVTKVRDSYWRYQKKPELFFDSQRFLRDGTKEKVSSTAAACAGGSTYTDNKRKNPPSRYQNEVSDAGFAYTNKICLAGEECSPILSLSREALA